MFRASTRRLGLLRRTILVAAFSSSALWPASRPADEALTLPEIRKGGMSTVRVRDGVVGAQLRHWHWSDRMRRLFDDLPAHDSLVRSLLNSDSDESVVIACLLLCPYRWEGEARIFPKPTWLSASALSYRRSFRDTIVELYRTRQGRVRAASVLYFHAYPDLLPIDVFVRHAPRRWTAAPGLVGCVLEPGDPSAEQLGMHEWRALCRARPRRGLRLVLDHLRDEEWWWVPLATTCAHMYLTEDDWKTIDDHDKIAMAKRVGRNLHMLSLSFEGYESFLVSREVPELPMVLLRLFLEDPVTKYRFRRQMYDYRKWWWRAGLRVDWVLDGNDDILRSLQSWFPEHRRKRVKSF